MTNLSDALEFADNPELRCACVLILDTSGSMTGDAINALNAGLRAFRDDLMNDNLARKRVEVAIVEFNTAVRVVQDFVTADAFQPPTLTAQGLTDMVGGIEKGLDLIAQRKATYKAHGIQYFRPWAFLITDGKATGYDDLAKRIRKDEKDGRFLFFAVGVRDADMNCLTQISSLPPAKLDGINFKDLFGWLSASLGQVSRSKPGEMVPLVPTRTWQAIPG